MIEGHFKGCPINYTSGFWYKTFVRASSVAFLAPDEYLFCLAEKLGK